VPYYFGLCFRLRSSLPTFLPPELDKDITSGDNLDNLDLQPPCMNVVMTLPTESDEIVERVGPARTRELHMVRVETVRVIAVSAVPIVTLIDCS
jgi:hypothetical protein